MNELEKLVEQKAKQMVEKKEKPQEITPSVSIEVPQVGKSYQERAREIVGAMATEEAIKDEELKRSITDRKKAALLNSADADMKREEAENKQADIKLQEANYGVYEGVAAYAGIKKPLPKRMQSILFTILSSMQMVWLILFGLPVSIINITADGIDSVVKKLGTLTKSAMWIVIACLVGFVIFALVQVAQFYLNGFGIQLQI